MQSATISADIGGLLGQVEFEVRVVRDVSRRLAASAAPKFSIFDFVRTDEMGLSACIAALLDPRGTHGQGSAYLKLFMQMLETEHATGWFDELHSARVVAEAPANGMRRLDIHVRLPGGRAIGVENKPWAADQARQLADYASFLEGTCPSGRWKLVYLSDREPSDRSIDREQLARYVDSGCLKLVTFQMLAGWLGQCAGVTRPAAVRVFVEQMEQFIRKRLCGEVDMSEAETVKEIVLGSPASLRAAILVGKTLDAVKKHLLEQQLRMPFEKAMHQIGATPVWDDDMLEMRTYTGFGARFAPHAAGYLRFEFDKAGLNGLFWGIRRSKKLQFGNSDQPVATMLVKTLEQAFGRGSSSAHWLWYSTDLRSLSPTESPIPKNWERAEWPWIRMQEGELVSDLARHVQCVKDVLQGSPGGEIAGFASPDLQTPGQSTR